MDPSATANFGTAFAVWASVVALVGAAIVYELVRVRGELAKMTDQLQTYIVGMERRVTTIETHLQLTTNSFRPHTGDR